MNDIRKNELDERLRLMSNKILDAMESLTDRLTAPPEAASPPLTLAAQRRQTANVLRLWRLCGKPACRRSRCCRGEPSECLGIALPLLPPETVESLVMRPKRVRRRG
jgi:hypothetical protein